MPTARLFNLTNFLKHVFRRSLMYLHKILSFVWHNLPSYSPILIIVAGYAVWQARIPVTIIEPFQLKGDLPFSGDIVADALQDGLASIHSDIERERQDRSLQSAEINSTDLRHMLVPDFGRVQSKEPTRFAVEVKGWSYQTIISVARSVLGTETTISGDAIVNGDKFILIARTGDAGPWESVASPMTIEGLKRASRDLAEKILTERAPALAATALLEDGQVDQALALLKREHSLRPTDTSTALNLCLGFRASRRYQEALQCYADLKNLNPNSTLQVSEWVAQVYFLSGNREQAIDQFEALANKGYRNALIGLGEALDANERPGDALKEYDRFLAQQPRERSKAVAHVNRGTALSHSGKHREALAEYDEALEHAPGDVLILVLKSVEVTKVSDLDTGIARLQAVVDENANSNSLPFGFLQLGILFEEKGDWQRAITEFRRATELRPNYVEAHHALAKALAHEGNGSEALSEYIRIARLSNSEFDRTYPEYVANEWLGNTLRDQGNNAAAESAYREAIRLEPKYGVAHSWLGLVLEKQGNLSQAIQEYRAALTDTESSVFDESGWRVLAQSHLNEALIKQVQVHRVGKRHRCSGCAIESHRRLNGRHHGAQQSERSRSSASTAGPHNGTSGTGLIL
jgi:tetratricopeptide (TPR) repeat protein